MEVVKQAILSIETAGQIPDSRYLRQEGKDFKLLPIYEMVVRLSRVFRVNLYLMLDPPPIAFQWAADLSHRRVWYLNAAFIGEVARKCRSREKLRCSSRGSIDNAG